MALQVTVSSPGLSAGPSALLKNKYLALFLRKPLILHRISSKHIALAPFAPFVRAFNALQPRNFPGFIPHFAIQVFRNLFHLHHHALHLRFRGFRSHRRRSSLGQLGCLAWPQLPTHDLELHERLRRHQGRQQLQDAHRRLQRFFLQQDHGRRLRRLLRLRHGAHQRWLRRP